MADYANQQEIAREETRKIFEFLKTVEGLTEEIASRLHVPGPDVEHEVYDLFLVYTPDVRTLYIEFRPCCGSSEYSWDSREIDARLVQHAAEFLLQQVEVRLAKRAQEATKAHATFLAALTKFRGT